MNKKLILPLLITVIALGYASCSRRDKVLATVGSQRITVGEFEEAYQAPPMTLDSAELSGAKRKMLDRMVEDKLLVAEAVSRGLDKDPATVREIEELGNNVLLGKLYQEEFQKKNQPGDKQLREVYKKIGTMVRARHILVQAEDEARGIAKALKGGAKFEDLARKQSIDSASGQQGGDLGWFGYGQMVEEFQDQAFSLQPGQVSPPFKTRFGWHIIKVDSTRQTEKLPPFEQIKAQLKMQLEQMAAGKAQEQAAAYVNKRRQDAKIKIDQQAVRELADKQAKQYGQGRFPMPDVSSDEQKKTVLTYKGHSWTVQAMYDNIHLFLRDSLNLNDTAAVNKSLEGIASRELLVARAKAKGYERTAAVKAQLSRMRDEKLAGAVYQKEINDKVAVTPDSVQNYYKAHQKEFFQPALSAVDLIMAKTKADADEIFRTLASGAKFEMVARERSIDPSKNSGGTLGRLARDDPYYPEIAKKAFEAPLNKATQPFATKQGYAIIKVSGRTPQSQMPLNDQVKEQIRDNLMKARSEALFKEYVSELRKKYPVTINEQLLAQAGAAGPNKEK
jgi:peptidyl-prolyl cis-trans isomerase C